MNEWTRITRRDNAMARRPPRPQPVPAPTPVAAESTTTVRPWVKYVVAVALIAGLIWQMSRRTPVGPSAGSLEVKLIASSIAPTEPARFKLGTYNIHHGKGTDRIRNLDRTADVLRGLDFAGLNEVHGPLFWEHEDQASALGRKLRLTALFTPAEQEWLHFRHGNGLLTRLDVEHWQVVPLERKYSKNNRNLVHVRVRAPNGVPVNVVVTHIDRADDRERREQLRAVGRYFLSLAEPAALLGDLNSDFGEREIQSLLDTPGVKDAMTEKFGLQKPRYIDWILVRGLDVVDAGTVGAGASDHPHLWAEVEVAGKDEGESVRGRE